MEITQGRILPVEEYRLTVHVKITPGGSFSIKGIRKVQGTTRYFLSMPSNNEVNVAKALVMPSQGKARKTKEKLLHPFNRLGLFHKN